ncbi:MAG: GNAT family N-acetyltransferase [Caldilineaceae bacterium]|nr:GNAT family N-acetyltransferase [Caldilineaceae bacterium]HRJ40631.1 GNAT family N-acetyltransferase [Caldilineaceae bacterium]
MKRSANESLSVRDATEADLDVLMRLKPSLAVHRDRLRDACQPGFRYLVLEDKESVIGFVCLVFVRPSYWSDGNSTEQLPTAIDFLIDAPLRSRGYGSFLLRAVEKLAAASEAKQLYLWVDPILNPRAYALYRRLGYQPLQEHPYPFHWEFVDSEGHLHSGDTWRLDMVRSL